MPVREVAAVGEIHAEHRVAGLQRGHIDGDVGGRAGMRLHVGVFRAEKFLGAIDRQLFHFVGDFAAAVVALARIALGVFVGEDRAHGFEHRFRDEIFARDQFQAGSLALGLFAEQVRDRGIDGVERALHAVVGFGTLGHWRRHGWRPCLWDAPSYLASARLEARPRE